MAVFTCSCRRFSDLSRTGQLVLSGTFFRVCWIWAFTLRNSTEFLSTSARQRITSAPKKYSVGGCGRALMQADVASHFRPTRCMTNTSDFEDQIRRYMRASLAVKKDLLENREVVSLIATVGELFINAFR